MKKKSRASKAINSNQNKSNSINQDLKSKGGYNKKQPFWFYLIIVLIPVIFFVALEFSLRILNYGVDTTQWVKIAPGKIMLNPDIAYRYFHSTQGIPSSNQNIFNEVKDLNTFRIFILGGSSAAGYPYSPNGDFGHYIKKKFETLYPQINAEVINIALTAINSYTIRDLMPGVLEQKPDLILIYAGHNEFYGALGVGSMESIGKSRSIINLTLYLEKYKTFALLRNFVKWISNFFQSNDSASAKKGGTLMARMAKDQLIALNSDTFHSAIEQFEGNIKDVFEMCKRASVPVIIGTLTSNLKDQKPFVSVQQKKYPPASKIYNDALILLQENKKDEALKAFKFAKDLDGLRFRAPEIINSEIISLAKEYNYPLVPIDSVFNLLSPDGIVGANLMTDHLHPTLQGYRLMGKLFFEAIKKNNYLPELKKLNISEEQEDHLMDEALCVSILDSVVAKYRILILKNDWPFSESKSVAYMLKLFNANDFVDSTALKLIDDKITWEKAHRNVATKFLAEKNYKEFAIELNVLIDQYPFIEDYYKFATEQLLSAKLFKEAYPFLKKGNVLFPSALYSKWLGIIDVSENKIDSAIKHLNSSLMYKNDDTQVLFNLAGAYSINKDYQNALNTIEKCLRINPNYPKANNLKQQLLAALKSK